MLTPLRFLTGMAALATASFVAAPAWAAGPVTEASSLTVKAGSTIEISLPSNASTGYGWQLANPLPPESPVSVTIHPETAAPAEGRPPLCGAPGTTRVTIRGLRRGTATIRLQYVRPWEKNQPPARTNTLAVTIE